MVCYANAPRRMCDPAHFSRLTRRMTHPAGRKRKQQTIQRLTPPCTSVYTITPNQRQPERFVASLLHQEREEAPKTRKKPRHKEVWAMLDSNDAALAHLASGIAQIVLLSKRSATRLTDYFPLLLPPILGVIIALFMGKTVVFWFMIAFIESLLLAIVAMLRMRHYARNGR